MEARSSVAVDVSRFFLFEVTGDSSEVINSSVGEDYWADDDAQSCSCDTSDVQSVRLFCGGDDDDDDGEVDRLGSSRCVGQEEGSDSQNEGEDDDGDEVNQSQNRQQKESSKQSGSVELVNEKDRDRLFWEACLAS